MGHGTNLLGGLGSPVHRFHRRIKAVWGDAYERRQRGVQRGSPLDVLLGGMIRTQQRQKPGIFAPHD